MQLIFMHFPFSLVLLLSPAWTTLTNSMRDGFSHKPVLITIKLSQCSHTHTHSIAKRHYQRLYPYIPNRAYLLWNCAKWNGGRDARDWCSMGIYKAIWLFMLYATAYDMRIQRMNRQTYYVSMEIFICMLYTVCFGVFYFFVQTGAYTHTHTGSL